MMPRLISLHLDLVQAAQTQSAANPLRRDQEIAL